MIGGEDGKRKARILFPDVESARKMELGPTSKELPSGKWVRVEPKDPQSQGLGFQLGGRKLIAYARVEENHVLYRTGHVDGRDDRFGGREAVVLEEGVCYLIGREGATKELVVGRASGIFLIGVSTTDEEQDVSGQHLVLCIVEGVLYAQDISRNGTQVRAI